MIRLKTEKDIPYLRESGKILSLVLCTLDVLAQEGLSLSELDKEAQKIIKEHNATSAFLGYRGEQGGKPYPASICTSLNDVIVHGIPNGYCLRKGDVISIDVGINYKGYITDGAFTKSIGKTTNKIEQFIKETRRALQDAITITDINHTLGDIGAIIEVIANKRGYGIAEGLTGHGVGFELHEDPSVYNFGTKNTGMKLKEGLVLAIEPMFTLGSGEVVEGKEGEFKTKDGLLAAHFEQTILITNTIPELLTKLPDLD